MHQCIPGETNLSKCFWIGSSDLLGLLWSLSGGVGGLWVAFEDPLGHCLVFEPPGQLLDLMWGFRCEDI